MNPYFSIVIPAYNAERFLARTLESVRQQTWRAWEVVLVDDGSTDRTGALADEAAARDGRVRVLHTANGGISAARNLAARHARAPWIAVCDADDTWHPAKLERQVAFIEGWRQARPLVAVGTGGYVVDAQDRAVRPLDFDAEPWDAYLREDTPVGAFVMINSSVVMRADDLREVGGWRGEYTPAEDTDLWTRLAERGAVVNLPERLTNYRLHASNVSHTGYVEMLLCTHHLLANARRRRRGEPEWTREEFDRHLRADPERHDALVRALTNLAAYTRSKNAWTSGRPLAAIGYLVRAALRDPVPTLRLLRRSEAVRRLVGRRLSPGGHIQ